jgi:S1-C subfamily serine protease
MSFSRTAGFVAVALFILPCLPASADNKMGYRLLSVQEASGLPHNQGALGLDVERAQQITDSGLTFSLIRVKQVRRNSAGARAGFHAGDQIIALDGRVFPTLAAFAAYIGSVTPGSQMMVDYMPAGTGPQQAQRLIVTVGQAGRDAPPNPQPSPEQSSTGMSTGTKLAIGAGAIALFGCYEMGCFSHRGGSNPPAQQK